MANQILRMFVRQEHTNFRLQYRFHQSLIQLSRRRNGTKVPLRCLFFRFELFDRGQIEREPKGSNGMAKNDELLARLNNKEDNFTERKLESARNYEFRKTIVAFANSMPENQTGILFIGVRNDGTVAGVNGADSLQKTIRNICETDCYPPIKHTCAVLVVEGKDVVAAEISHSNQRPHFAGPAFVRVGSESKIATPELYQDLLTSHCSHAGQLLKLKN